MATVIVESNLPMVAADLEAAAAAVTPLAERSLLVVSAAIRDLIVTMMRSATPKRTGRLADSTVGDIAAAARSATITIRQPAESIPDQSGNWGGIHYVKYVVGGRGPVRPVLKKALYWPGLPHPVMGSGPAAANPYPERVMTDAEAPVVAMLRASGLGMIASVVNVMKGRP